MCVHFHAFKKKYFWLLHCMHCLLQQFIFILYMCVCVCVIQTRMPKSSNNNKMDVLYCNNLLYIENINFRLFFGSTTADKHGKCIENFTNTHTIWTFFDHDTKKRIYIHKTCKKKIQKRWNIGLHWYHLTQ